MSDYSNSNERELFRKALEQAHDRVKPCFMTGKGCVYGERIEEALALRRKLAQENHGARPWRGFVIMPFRPNLKVFLENCLKPFFYENYGLDPRTYKSGRDSDGRPICNLESGEQVSRPGIVICEGICRRIQEADFIVADISATNDNVFYELGLAYGIGQKILIIHQLNSQFGKESANRLDCKAFEYKNLALIEDKEFAVSGHFWRDSSRESGSAEHTWQQPRTTSPDPKAKAQIRLFEMMTHTGEMEKDPVVNREDEDIRLLFRAHIKSHVGLAMDRIYRELEPKDARKTALQSYRDSIIRTYLRSAEEINPQDKFATIRGQIDNAYCLIVRTGKSCHPMSYFWLGYAHARGKNVIPITVLEKDDRANHFLRRNDIPPWVSEFAELLVPAFARNCHDNVADLAFDIRAQRHMIFNPARPDLLEKQVEQTLQEMITSDFGAWSRKRFWEKMLGRRGEVSILTGGLHSKEHNREMIGDWDLRAASQLTSYFSQNQFHPRIETPVYQQEYACRVSNIPPSAYIPKIMKEIGLARKTCIIIASPDVNPLTEIVLGKLFGVAENELFSARPASEISSDAVEVWKVRKVSQDGQRSENPLPGPSATHVEQLQPVPSNAPRAFFQERQGDGSTEQRGFRTNWSGHAIGPVKLQTYYSQNDKEHPSFKIYAHLVVAKNPFTAPEVANEPALDQSGEKEAGSQSHYLIVLNGVSGPATFALTHVLTGGGKDEFVFYGKDSDPNFFDPAAASEEILNQILEVLNSSPDHRGVQCFIEVDVGPAPADSTAQPGVTFDWRRICGWRLANNMLGSNLSIKPL